MNDPLIYPCLRHPLDIRRQLVEDKEILVLSCPIGVTEQPLGLLAAVAPILQLFDGKNSVQQIATQFGSYGVTPEIIDQLVQILEKNLFLASPKFLAARDLTFKGFKDSPTRPASLAGLSYPLDAQKLREHIDGFLYTLENPVTVQLPSAPLIGLVSPHIDYQRGGTCYGITWRNIKDHEHDLYLVMGTSHQYSQLMFHLTAKNFATPLGVLNCDREFVARLGSLYGDSRSFADEYLHRREHSLELQLPFLRRIKDRPTIVPILVGGFHHMLQSGRKPSEFEEYETFAASLTECVKNRIANGIRVCFVAGVDMSHIGKYFGDADPLNAEFLSEIAKRDAQYLETIKDHNPGAMFSHIEEDLDRRRVCGFPTMYLLLDVLQRLGIKYKAEVYNYQQAVNYQNDCAVTFAGAGLYQTPPEL